MKRREAMEREDSGEMGGGRGGWGRRRGEDRREGGKEETGSHPCIKRAAKARHDDDTTITPALLTMFAVIFLTPVAFPAEVRSTTIDD